MKADEIVMPECICGRYDFEPFKSGEEMIHCYECNAYHDGKLAQAKVSFKAGMREVVEFVEKFLIGKDKTQLIIRQTDVELWNYQLKEWGIDA